MSDLWAVVFMGAMVSPFLGVGVAMWVSHRMRRKRVRDRTNAAMDRAIRNIYANQRLTADGARKAFADWKPL